MKMHTQSGRSRGMALVYLTIAMSALIGIVSLAVDLANVQTAKTQVQAAADSAALYAAEGLIGGTPSSVRARAIAAAADNKMNGTSIVLTNSDIVFGIWDSSAKTFNVLSGSAESGATAVQVTVNRTKSRGTQLSLTFAGMLGFSSVDIVRSATASLGKVTTQGIPASACPWLAGMPSTAIVANTGGNPTAATGALNASIEFATSGGTPVRFANAGGSSTWDPGAGTGSAGVEGDSTYIAAQAACNGINTTKAPINAMMGIFLNDNEPDLTGMAPILDFSTAASRDFTTLSPQLKQVFFIGDGLNSSGQLQTFNAPAGATRLFIAVMDEKGWWWDNVGTLTFTVVQGNAASLVK
jgi:Flp pilus assembly protein TadG